MSFHLELGRSPILVSMPHVGTTIPDDLKPRYVDRALAVEDTDWHLHQLYDWLGEMGASVLRPELSRYVIDLNRPPDDAPMYPRASNTELCPTRFFTGDALYRDGLAPDPTERARRRDLYWQPYHDALRTELDRIKARHGFALLWDAHSIRSRIPWLFDGDLPGLNIGTADHASADESITDAVAAAAARFPQVTHVVNGRFKGGYITRHYGQPANAIHAVQMELVQANYMDEGAPYAYHGPRATATAIVLRRLLERALGALEQA